MNTLAWRIRVSHSPCSYSSTNENENRQNSRKDFFFSVSPAKNRKLRNCSFLCLFPLSLFRLLFTFRYDSGTRILILLAIPATPRAERS